MEDKNFPSPLRGAIVAMTRDRVIGIDGNLPWHYREDLQRFKKRTMGCAIIMGRITWDSIGRKELPGRRNIVISRSEVDGMENYRGVDDAIAACGENDLWIIGGAQIFSAAMAHLNFLDITWVPDNISQGDVVRFPDDFDLTAQWQCISESPLPDNENLVNTIYRRAD